MFTLVSFKISNFFHLTTSLDQSQSLLPQKNDTLDDRRILFFVWVKGSCMLWVVFIDFGTHSWVLQILDMDFCPILIYTAGTLTLFDLHPRYFFILVSWVSYNLWNYNHRFLNWSPPHCYFFFDMCHACK